MLDRLRKLLRPTFETKVTELPPPVSHENAVAKIKVEHAFTSTRQRANVVDDEMGAAEDFFGFTDMTLTSPQAIENCEVTFIVSGTGLKIRHTDPSAPEGIRDLQEIPLYPFNDSRGEFAEMDRIFTTMEKTGLKFTSMTEFADAGFAGILECWNTEVSGKRVGLGYGPASKPA